MSRLLASAISAMCRSCLMISAPCSCVQLLIEHVQQAVGGVVAAQAAELVQRLPLQVEQLGQLFVAAVGVFDSLGQLALVAFDHPLLLAELLGLLLEGVLPFVERAFAFVQFLAQLGQFAFAVGLLLDGRFLDFQFGFALKLVASRLALSRISLASVSASRRRSRSSNLTKMAPNAAATTAVTITLTISPPVTARSLSILRKVRGADGARMRGDTRASVPRESNRTGQALARSTQTTGRK